MRTILGTEAFEILKKAKIPIAPLQLADTGSVAASLPVPCVLKVPSVSHKTEVGAVEVVRCKKDIIGAYKRLFKFGRIFWQPYVEGVEVIIGLKQDRTFGRVIMFGLGGVFTEMFKDVSFRVCPINGRDASAMISEIKGYQILKGWRGKPAVDFRLLNDVIMKASSLPSDISELDINPFIINSKEGFAVDVRAILV